MFNLHSSIRSWFHSLLSIRLLLLVILGAGSAEAQPWTKLHTFDGYISLVKFLNTNTGFVALGIAPGKPANGPSPVELDKTTDGGKTWIKCSIPSGYGGEIADLNMVDSLNGWIAMAAYGGSGDKALWRTTNGGLMWNETQLAGCGNAVRVTPAAMIVTDVIGNFHISTDGGNTFFDGSINSTNGVDFVDQLHGVISVYRGANWLNSSDGGITWKNINVSTESWSMYADSGTSKFYAAPEGNTLGQPRHLIIYSSSDFGNTWNLLAQFPFYSTGHLTGIGDQYLFCQVQDTQIINGVTYTGFYYSTDQGVSWTSIGGPSAFGDTRFSVINACSGINLYGFDDQSPGSLFQYSFGSGNATQPGQIHREAASAYFGQLDSLMLTVDISSEINLDSLWPYITEIQATYSWDSSVAKYAGYNAPSGWILNGLANHGDAANIDIQNSGSTATQPLDLGTALFHPATTQLATSWVELPSLVIDVGNQAISLCVTDNEDNHWAVKTLGVLDEVAEVPAVTEDISIYPNPAGDELFVQNANELPASIEMYDVIGRDVARANATPSSTSSIDIASLPSGAYFLVCHIAGRTETKRITKQ